MFFFTCYIVCVLQFYNKNMNLQDLNSRFFLNNKFLISSKLLHLTLIFLSYVIFWDYWIYFPLTEDGAFYGFLAKSLLGGSILHQDIPIATNSLNIYALAFFMKLFDSSVVSFKIYHLIFSISLSFVIYFILRKNFLPIYALIGSLAAGILLHTPHTLLDLGRNPIIISLFLLFLGIYYYFYSKSKFKYFYFGVLLGLSALVRETFLFIAFIIFVDLLIKFYRGECKSTDIKIFLFGFVTALSINAFILSYYGIWAEYLHNMLFSGTNFRYNEGFLSLKRIISNMNAFKIGYSNYYDSLILLSLVSYIFKDNDKIFSFFKFVLVPAFLIEAIIVNLTVNYSIQPILVMSVILSFYSIKHIMNVINNLDLNMIEEAKKKFNLINIKPKYALYLFLFLFFLNNNTNIATIYSAANKIALANKHNKLIDTNPNRILDIINRISHKSISAYSQYPTLFRSKISYKTKWPFTEDLSSAANMGNKKIWSDQLEKLNSSIPPNLYIDKTSGSFISKETEIGKIFDNNYIEIARFAKKSEKRHFDGRMVRDRILLSKQHFNSSYNFISKSYISLDEVGSVYKYNNIHDDHIIIKVVPNEVGCEIGLSVQSALSEIKYQRNLSSESNIYNFILPKNWAFIKNIKNKNCNSYIIYEYKQK